MDLNTDVLDAKAFLLQKNAQGVSVYDHLSRVLAALLAERPAAAVEALEEVSAAVKAGTYAPAGPRVSDGREQTWRKKMEANEKRGNR